MVVAELTLYKIWEIKTLGGERDADAKKMLQDAAWQVEPIMRKRKWQVPLLCEFCPRDGGLLGLNVNGGEKIMVRLRRHGPESEFLSYESVLGTLLHELTHIECGPHDAKFYKLLDEITSECEELMAKGTGGTGAGFDAKGQRLGGFRHNPPPTGLRQAALAAAEKRARTSALMPSGPRRLGGNSSIMRDLSPVQAAAMAAERRLRDDIWCGAPATSGPDGLQKAQDLMDSPSVRGQNGRAVGTLGNAQAPNGKGKGTSSMQEVERHAASSSHAQQSHGQGTSRRSSPSQRPPTAHTQATSHSLDMWECSICTLLNPPTALLCGACGTSRQQDSETIWTCSRCTLQNPVLLTNCAACSAAMEKHETHTTSTAPTIPPLTNASKSLKTWTCRQCTLENTVLLDTCEACGQWRFSHGPPVATRGPAGT